MTSSSEAQTSLIFDLCLERGDPVKGSGMSVGRSRMDDMCRVA